MDEFSAILKARELIAKVNPNTIPVSVEAYAAHVNAVIRVRDDLEPNEPGWAFESRGRHFICVNANDRLERRRYTVCHEVAHIALGLPSNHQQSPWSGSYARKSAEEIVCDAFAAELLLPHHLFKPLADKADISLGTIDQLAVDFVASITATGSRFAAVLTAPCAFVLSERGKVRYTSRSASLREANAWITPKSDIPRDSWSARIRNGDPSKAGESIDADIWFENWQRGGALLEEARHSEQWDQTLTLLWFEDEEIPTRRCSYARDEDDEEQGLRELDGVLPWPGKKRRK